MMFLIAAANLTESATVDPCERAGAIQWIDVAYFDADDADRLAEMYADQDVDADASAAYAKRLSAGYDDGFDEWESGRGVIQFADAMADALGS